MRNGSVSLLSAPPVFARHRFAALIGGAVLVAIVFAFGATALSMVDIWRRSDTFSHGFLVVPIALWLVWRRRAELARVPVRPFWPGMLFVAAAGFLWLLGSLADANVVEHFALVLMMQSARACRLRAGGGRATLIFPLVFLLFAVPFGEAFVPQLIDWTADFTVFALKLTGVPVYREGNNFVIPTGQWSVVEACSGIRYLIASLMAGTLYAYLMYSSAWRRAAFIAAAILVSIVANWLRAYLIVMMGHLSGNELAAGVDHLIYGWIFFGIVLLGMFWVGARFRDDGTATAVSSQARENFRSGSRTTSLGCGGRRRRRHSLVAAGFGSGCGGCRLAEDAAVHRRKPRAGRQSGKTQGPRGGQHFSGHRVELRQVFERDGERVVVYIALLC